MGVCTSRNLVLVVAWPALGGQKLHKVVVLVMLSVAAVVAAGLHRWSSRGLFLSGLGSACFLTLMRGRCAAIIRGWKLCTKVVMGVCTSRNLVLVVAWPALGGQKLHKVVVLVMLSVAAVTAGLHRMLVVLVMRSHFVCLRVLWGWFCREGDNNDVII